MCSSWYNRVSLVYIHVYFTYKKNPTAHTKDKKKCIYTLPDSNRIMGYNSRNFIYAFEPLVPRKSRILLSVQSNTYYRLTHNEVYNNQMK